MKKNLTVAKMMNKGNSCNNRGRKSVIKVKEDKVMRARKKRTSWQIFLWGLRHPWLYCRAAALYEIHHKRISREVMEWNQKQVNKYDPEFERWWRREQRKPRRIKVGFNTYKDVPRDLY